MLEPCHGVKVLCALTISVLYRITSRGGRIKQIISESNPPPCWIEMKFQKMLLYRYQYKAVFKALISHLENWLKFFEFRVEKIINLNRAIVLIVLKSFKKCKKNLQNYCGSKNLLSIFQMFTKGLSLQKVPIVLAIASKSVDQFHRSLENLSIVLLTMTNDWKVFKIFNRYLSKTATKLETILHSQLRF